MSWLWSKMLRGDVGPFYITLRSICSLRSWGLGVMIKAYIVSRKNHGTMVDVRIGPLRIYGILEVD